MSRSTVTVLILIVCAAVIGKTAGSAVLVECRDDEPATSPLLFVRHDVRVGTPLPDGHISPPILPRLGLIQFALWDDGTLVYSPWHHPGERLKVTTVPPATVAMVREDIDRYGIMQFNHQYGGHGLPQVHMGIQQGNRTALMVWDEGIEPGLARATDQEYRDFVNAWYMLKITIASIPKPPGRPIYELLEADGTFRGIDPDGGAMPSWMDLTSRHDVQAGTDE